MKLSFFCIKRFVFDLLPAVSVAIFAALKWELGIIEAIIVIMSVGLSVDFVVHFGVGYIHANSRDIERKRKTIKDRYLASLSTSSDKLEVQTVPSKSDSFRSKKKFIHIFCF